jgi:hypothetical protein
MNRAAILGVSTIVIVEKGVERNERNVSYL